MIPCRRPLREFGTGGDWLLAVLLLWGFLFLSLLLAVGERTWKTLHRGCAG